MKANASVAASAAAVISTGEGAVFPILIALSFSHMMNDTVQSLIPAIYPMLKSSFSLDFTQIGLITLTFQMTASILQPMVGLYTDHHPKPFSLAFGMGCSLLGLLLLSVAPHFWTILIAAAMVGMGSSVFHPESSRIARMASGGQHGLAQSLFQVGGNVGSSMGPLLALFIVLPRGQGSIAWFSLIALLAIIVLANVGRWYQKQRTLARSRPARRAAARPAMSTRKVAFCLAILFALTFSKHFYLASLNSYYTFYIMGKFGLSAGAAQVYLFIFLFSAAVGTIVGGPLGDRFGRKYVIWVSILGVLPFTIALPYANLFWTGVLTVCIGLILSSAFSAILVYAQELVPGKVGMIAGLFFGLAFGLGGLGAAVLGRLADLTSIDYVYHVCSFLPVLGILTVFLPNLDGMFDRRGGLVSPAGKTA